AEAGVQTVEVRRLPEGDEELRAAGIWIASVGHAQAALKMGPMAGPRLLTKDPVHRAASAVAFRIAALSHEALKDTMKVQGVVKTLVHEADKVADGFRSLVLEQLEHDGAFGRCQLDARQVIGLRFGFARRFFFSPEITVLLHQRLQLG